MKKIVFVLLFVFAFSCACFAKKNVKDSTVDNEPKKNSVCVFPRNEEIETYVKTFLLDDETKLKKCSINATDDAVETGDKRLMEYISLDSDAEILVFPITSEVSGFKHLTLYVWKDGIFRKIYESLDRQQTVFPADVLIKLYPYFTDTKCALAKIDKKNAGTSVKIDGKEMKTYDNYYFVEPGEHTFDFSSIGFTAKRERYNIEEGVVNLIEVDLQQPIYRNLTISSKPEATLFIDGHEIGQTPYTVEEYSVPLAIRLHADGFSDRIVSVAAPTDSIKVVLKPELLDSKNLLKKRQNNYYFAFGRTLLLFGGWAATRAIGLNVTSNVKKGINYGFEAAIAVSLADLGFDLFRYFRTLKNIAP